MALNVSTEYDSQNNICIVRMVGSPESNADVDSLISETMKVCTRDHKVYTITDISKLDLTKFEFLDSYQKRIKPFSNERIAFAVSLCTKTFAGIATRMFNIITGLNVKVAKTQEEAFEIIKKEQQSSGVFVPLR